MTDELHEFAERHADWAKRQLAPMRTTKHVGRLPQRQRFVVARQFAGHRVTLVRNYLTGPQEYVGMVVTVALSTSGGADVIVLRQDGINPVDIAISLAQVVSIETKGSES